MLLSDTEEDWIPIYIKQMPNKKMTKQKMPKKKMPKKDMLLQREPGYIYIWTRPPNVRYKDMPTKKEKLPIHPMCSSCRSEKRMPTKREKDHDCPRRTHKVWFEELVGQATH